MQQKIKQEYRDILIFFLTFGIMFSYYYFAPVVFLAIFIQMIVEIKKRKEKIFSVKNILSIVISLIRFGLQVENYYSNGINLPGAIYQNFITNTIIFLMLSVFYICYSIKNKKEKFSNKILIISIIFLIIAFIGMKFEKISEYYYYKIYYMIWIPLIIVAFNSIELFYKKNIILTYIGIGIYSIGMIIAMFFNKNLLFFDIYQNIC